MSEENRKKRICREFARLVEIDAPSFGERQMADYLKKKLAELGAEVEEDKAGEVIGGNAGNILGILKGTLPGPPVFLCAHMDTVEPALHKKAVFLEDGTITSAGDTVLGADDAAGLVQILEGIRMVQEAGCPHRDLEILFPAAEEVYTKGSSAFDFTKLRGKEAYVLYLSGPVGMAAAKAPSLISFQITIQGKAAHAGFEPKKGIHAIVAAAKAIAEVPQGHLDQDTTCNVGLIKGGTATNIVPEACMVQGEIRSFAHEKALACMENIKRIFEKEAENAGASCQAEIEIHLEAYETEKTEVVVRHFQKACKDLGLPGGLTETFGGSDNNSFAKHGIPGLVLSNGMYQAHSTKEYTTYEDLEKGAKLIARLIQMPWE